MDIKNNLECLELEFRVATDQDFLSDLGACNLHCSCKSHIGKEWVSVLHAT